MVFGRRPLRGGVDRNVGAVNVYNQVPASPLTRGRGSKPDRHPAVGQECRVAPHAGAWIET